MVSGTNVEDSDLADTLRRDDPDQFHTLVRMHLSFVLDLNTDECDGIVEKAGKFRPMKWSFTPFAKKSKPALSKPPVDGVCLTQDCISKVYQLIEWLRKEDNVIQEGIFRRSGKLTRQQELKAMLDNGDSLQLDDGNFSVHDCASVLKNFLAQLPEPLLTEAHYPAHCQIAELCSGKGEPIEEERLLKALQLVLLLLPPENLQLLKDLIGLLHLTASHDHLNKMSSDNLATLFTPHLLCPRKLSPEALHSNSQTMSRVVSFMIKQGPALFLIPTQLATDIRAYWTTREQRKLMAKKDINESVCDGMAAKTVFTFVDRERTAEASGSANPTEAALAQLYAHIQSLPESSKKRKLIKQFNKENGQGTPQLIVESQTNVRTGRSRHRSASSSVKQRHRSRSLGDSIKKHLPVFGKMQREMKKNGDEGSLESPYVSPSSKGRLFFSKNNLEASNAIPVVTPVPMPSIKKSLMTGASEETLRSRLKNSSTRQTPPSSTQDTSSVKDMNGSSSDSHSTGDERSHSSLKRTTPNGGTHLSEDVCAPTKSPRLEPESPFPVPLPPSPERLEAKHLQGTFRDESWPVSTAPAPNLACATVTVTSSSNVLPNPILTTPRNVLSWITSTPACARACQMDSSLSNCLLTPSNVNGSNSMSPITRSTQKMPKAMQEDMMTPRSRKPVVALSSSNLSQLAHLSGWGRSGSGELRRDTLLSEASLSRKLVMRDDSFAEEEHEDSVCIPIEKMLAKELPQDGSKDIVIASAKQASDETKGCDCCSPGSCGSCRENGSMDYYSCGSEGSALTGTFREIVLSRSVLTASPVDLSFSSHTGDFDSSSDRDVRNILSNENMSESLLFCLDGNEPSSLNESGRLSHNSRVETSSTGDRALGGSHYESSGVEADEENNSCSLTSIDNKVLCGKDASDSLLSISPSVPDGCSASISVHETSF